MHPATFIKLSGYTVTVAEHNKAVLACVLGDLSKKYLQNLVETRKTLRGYLENFMIQLLVYVVLYIYIYRHLMIGPLRVPHYKIAITICTVNTIKSS